MRVTTRANQFARGESLRQSFVVIKNSRARVAESWYDAGRHGAGQTQVGPRLEVLVVRRQLW
jgi:hypothetical protein